MTRIETLLDFFREDPDDAFTMFALASEYVKDGDLSNGQMYFEMLLSKHPDYVGTYYHLGKLYEQLGWRDRALETYDAGIGVATTGRDHHTRSELQSAKMNLELAEDE
ncbi:MAG: tetratricopeptide repeat protein [Rhodothermales bacterium]|nr:tetratricopeptide repeat protein [Rhodothermales bacterium]